MAQALRAGREWVSAKESVQASNWTGVLGVDARIQPISRQNPADGESLKSNVRNWVSI
jgi:hypothetical protein